MGFQSLCCYWRRCVLDEDMIGCRCFDILLHAGRMRGRMVQHFVHLVLLA